MNTDTQLSTPDNSTVDEKMEYGKLQAELFALVGNQITSCEGGIVAIINPCWVSDEWTDQIPSPLQRLWNQLSLEAKLVAYLVAIESPYVSGDSPLESDWLDE